MRYKGVESLSRTRRHIIHTSALISRSARVAHPASLPQIWVREVSFCPRLSRGTRWAASAACRERQVLGEKRQHHGVTRWLCWKRKCYAFHECRRRCARKLIGAGRGEGMRRPGFDGSRQAAIVAFPSAVIASRGLVAKSQVKAIKPLPLDGR